MRAVIFLLVGLVAAAGAAAQQARPQAGYWGAVYATPEHITGKTCTHSDGVVLVEDYREQDPQTLFYSGRISALLSCRDDRQIYVGCARAVSRTRRLRYW